MEDKELKQYLAEMENYKCELEVWKTQTLHETALYHNVNMQGQGALKAAILINGGASVALLAFIGAAMGKNAMSKDANSLILLALCLSMLLFIIGTLCSAVASGVTYLAGLVDSHSTEKKVSKWKFWRHWCFYNTIAILLVIASYVLFLIGSLNAYFEFVSVFKQ